MKKISKKKKVLVSGCYDILHAGHIQFFEDARALGDHLTVCFASDDVLMLAKKRVSAIPEDNKEMILRSLRCVDDAFPSSDLHPVFDFAGHVDRIRPHILAVTEDDRNIGLKKAFCDERGIRLAILPKHNPVTEVSTTSVLSSIKNVREVPLRVDFAGGWLDVPKLARKGAYIVNCAISPLVSLKSWPYEKGAGLGGSAAYAILQAQQGVRSELDMGVGWQDPAVIAHTGLCVWKSGPKPALDAQFDPRWLKGTMLIVWTGNSHNSPDHVSARRDYRQIMRAGRTARDAAFGQDLKKMAQAVNMSYKAQLGEGMKALPRVVGAIARKYLGGGYGGYALYLFSDRRKRDAALKMTEDALKIEAYIKEII